MCYASCNRGPLLGDSNVQGTGYHRGQKNLSSVHDQVFVRTFVFYIRSVSLILGMVVLRLN